MNFRTGNGEEKSYGFCPLYNTDKFTCFWCISIVWARNHGYRKDDDVRLFDREKSSDFSEDLLQQPRATKELGKGNDCDYCCQCPECCWEETK